MAESNRRSRAISVIKGKQSLSVNKAYQSKKSIVFLPSLLESKKEKEAEETYISHNKTIDYSTSFSYKPKITTNSILINASQKANLIKNTTRPDVQSTKISFQLIELIKTDPSLSHYIPYIEIVQACLKAAVYVQSSHKNLGDLPLFAHQEQYSGGIPFFKICNKVLTHANNIKAKMNSIKEDYNRCKENYQNILSHKDEEISQLQSLLNQPSMKKQIESTIGKLEMMRIKNCESDDKMEECVNTIKLLKDDLNDTEEKMMSILREKTILLSSYNCKSMAAEQLEKKAHELEERVAKCDDELFQMSRKYKETLLHVDKIERQNIEYKLCLKKMIEEAHKLKVDAGIDSFDQYIGGLNTEELYS